MPTPTICPDSRPWLPADPPSTTAHAPLLNLPVEMGPCSPTRARDTRTVTQRDPLPTSLGDPFTVQQARDAGLTLSRLRAGDLESPFHGIRRFAQPEAPYSEDPIERQRQRGLQLVRDCLAFTAVEGRPTVFTHITAARLYGIPLPWSHEVRKALDVAAVVPAHPPQGNGVIGHLI